MTPEALSTYLLHYFPEDVVQEVILEYLTWKGKPIRYPKRWGWIHASWRQTDAYREQSIRGHRVDLPDDLVSREPSPLTRAEQRQRIDRFTQTMKVSCKPSQKWSILSQRNV